MGQAGDGGRVKRRAEAALVATAGMLVFSRVFGLSLVLPGFVAYARGLPGATDVLVGTAFGAYGLTLALMQLPMGWLSDRVGRRPVLVAGTLLFVAGSAWCAVADTIHAMVAARLVQGLGAVSSVAMAMVGESVAPERRTFSMAMVGIPAGLGFFVGLLAAGVLEGTLVFPQLFWLAASIGVAAALPLLWLRPGPARPTLPASPATGPSVMTLAAAGFTMNFALTTVLFHLGDAGRTSGTLLFAPLAVALVVMALLSRRIDRRRLTWQPVAIGLLVLAAGAAAAVLPGPPAWRFGAALFFSAHATLSAVLPSQVSRIAGASGGRGHGVQNVVAYLGTFVAGPIAGALVAVPEGNLLLLAGLVVAVAGTSVWRSKMDTADAVAPTR